MANHVDIIKTDPLATAEKRLARAALEDGSVTIDNTEDPPYWLELLTKASSIDPDDDPEGFLSSLNETLDGTYVYATEVLS